MGGELNGDAVNHVREGDYVIIYLSAIPPLGLRACTGLMALTADLVSDQMIEQVPLSRLKDSICVKN